MQEARLYAPAAARNRDPILAVLRANLPASGTVLEIASGTGEHVAHFAAALPALTWQPSDPVAANRASIDAWAENHPNIRPALALDAATAALPTAGKSDAANTTAPDADAANADAATTNTAATNADAATTAAATNADAATFAAAVTNGDVTSTTATLINADAATTPDAAAVGWPIAHAQAVLCINMIHIAPWEAAIGLFAGASRILPPTGLLALYGPYRRTNAPMEPGNAAFDADLRQRNPAWGLRTIEAVSALATASHFGAPEIVSMPKDNFMLLFRKF